MFGFFLTLATAAQAGADFYGVKMKSEDFAKNVFLVDGPKIPDFTNNRPGTDKRVYAYGYMSSFVGGGKGIALEVFNHSDAPIATDKLFRELTLVTYDGRRYDRAEPEMMWSRPELGPGQHATFNFKFPGARIHRDEVRMVICSFDMGQTQIFLFPLKGQEKVSDVSIPAKPGMVKKKVKKTVKKKVWVDKKPEGKVEAVLAHCITPVRLVQSVFTAFGPKPAHKSEAAPGKEEVEIEEVVEEVVEVPAADTSSAPEKKDRAVSPDHPLVTTEQVVDGVRYRFKPEQRKKVEEAQKQTEVLIERDRPWTLSRPGAAYPHVLKTRRGVDLPRREATVLFVNPDYGFVVVDAGLEQGFGKNAILNVMRAGRRIAKVMVTKPRDNLAGAVILPEWRTRDEVRVGDIVGISS